MLRASRIGIASLCLSLATGCSKTPLVVSTYNQEGIASWYGHPFDGRKTASGEIFNMEQLTAAHRTYPFGTVLRVVDKSNRQSVEVRINDRGPFVAGRIIDLSHGAAGRISMTSIADVGLQVISQPSSRGAENYAVQVGKFASRPDADSLRKQMETQHGRATLIFREGDRTWRVLVGLEPTEAAADKLLQQIGSQYGPAFVVLMDSAD